MERRVLLAVSLGLVLTATQACKRSEALKRNDTLTGMSGENLPFHEEPVAGAGDPGAVLSSVKRSALPFPTSSQPRFLAAGTLVTVQLRESLSTARAHAGEQFGAVVTTPLVVGEDTLVESGTPVTGRIESEGLRAGQPGRAPGAGYFRLTLTAMTLEGRPVAVRTSSLFVRGTVQPKGILVPKGHRLTFRLMDAVELEDARATLAPSTSSRANP